MHIEVARPAHLQPLVLQLTTFSARSRFLSALDLLSGKLSRVIQGQQHRVPRHSQLNAWWHPSPNVPVTRHLVALQVNLVERLRRDPLPFDATFVYGQNTSIAEQNWVHFNKFRESMRSMARAEYLLFAHRIAHLRNSLLAAKL